MSRLPWESFSWREGRADRAQGRSKQARHRKIKTAARVHHKAQRRQPSRRYNQSMPTYIYSGIAGAAVPDGKQADVLVHIPESVGDLQAGRYGVVIYLHGFDNCIVNVAAPGEGIHQPPHPTANLIEQLEACGKRAVLFLPETRAHAKTGDAGSLMHSGGLSQLWQETRMRLAQEPHTQLPKDAPEPCHGILMAHSGSYLAAKALIHEGGLPIHEVCLLDALYGETAFFEELARTTLLGDEGTHRRFVSLHHGGKPARHGQALASAIERLAEDAQRKDQTWLRAEPPAMRETPNASAGDTPDMAAETLDEELLSRRVVIAQVPTAHAAFGATHVLPLLRTSRLPTR